MTAFGLIYVESVLRVSMILALLPPIGAANLKNFKLLILGAVNFVNGLDGVETAFAMELFAVPLKLSKLIQDHSMEIWLVQESLPHLTCPLLILVKGLFLQMDQTSEFKDDL